VSGVRACSQVWITRSGCIPDFGNMQRWVVWDEDVWNRAMALPAGLCGTCFSREFAFPKPAVGHREERRAEIGFARDDEGCSTISGRIVRKWQAPNLATPPALRDFSGFTRFRTGSSKNLLLWRCRRHEFQS
jgi:hypothetical protein